MESVLSVCFTSMKLRYVSYSSSIEQLKFVTPTDKVNVFINFESVLNNISIIKDLNTKLVLERDFDLTLETEMLNLIAHYKKFFKGNGLDTKVYLYYTDLLSNDFISSKYNDDYRMYYKTKFISNPKFQLLGNKLVSSIIPRIKQIIEFIPDVYFISGINIEGSIIPKIISESDKTRKNFIISTDKYETQYQLDDRTYCGHYIKRSPRGTKVLFQFKDTISSFVSDETLHVDYYNIFANPVMYSLLLAVTGDRLRSIEPINGIGPKTLFKIINQHIELGNINKNSSSTDLIMSIIPSEHQDRVYDNFHTIDLSRQYTDLSESNKFAILSQIIDRSDINSLLKINSTLYKNKIMLQELIN